MLLLFLLARALAIFCIVALIGWLGVVLHFQDAKTASRGLRLRNGSQLHYGGAL
jgi:hypothetical protein